MTSAAILDLLDRTVEITSSRMIVYCRGRKPVAAAPEASPPEFLTHVTLAGAFSRLATTLPLSVRSAPQACDNPAIQPIFLHGLDPNR
jgi:hypothetical protein